MQEFFLQFKSDNFLAQDFETLKEDIDVLANKIEKVMNLPVKVKALKSGRNKDKTHFVLECMSDDINILLSQVDGKWDLLKTLGIEKLHLWFYYEYVAQCNMEFSNPQLAIMARNNIKLLITCSEEQETDQL